MLKSQLARDERRRSIKAAVDHSLYQDKDWYIIPRNSCFWYLGTKHQSYLFHVCPKTWIYNANPVTRLDPKIERHMNINFTTFRVHNANMKRPCSQCNVAASDSLIALWRLHNWDTL